MHEIEDAARNLGLLTDIPLPLVSNTIGNQLMDFVHVEQVSKCLLDSDYCDDVALMNSGCSAVDAIERARSLGTLARDIFLSHGRSLNFK